MSRHGLRSGVALVLVGWTLACMGPCSGPRRDAPPKPVETPDKPTRPAARRGAPQAAMEKVVPLREAVPPGDGWTIGKRSSEGGRVVLHQPGGSLDTMRKAAARAAKQLPCDGVVKTQERDGVEVWGCTLQDGRRAMLTVSETDGMVNWGVAVTGEARSAGQDPR